MDLFNRNKKPKNTNPTQKIEEENRSYYSGALTFNSISSYVSSQNMRLSSVYCAVNAISNAVATLPLNIYNFDSLGFKQIFYNHPAFNLLNKQPSKNLSRFNFYKMVISSIFRGGGVIKADTSEEEQCIYNKAISVMI